MDSRRILNKLKKSSFAEIRFRLLRILRIYLERSLYTVRDKNTGLESIIKISGFAEGLDGSRYAEFWRKKRRFYFTPESKEELENHFKNNFPEKLAHLCTKADKICSLEIQIFDRVLSYSGEKIDWLKDPLSRQSWPLLHWSKIRVVGAPVDCDPKYVWELNRHQFLLNPAMAYWFSGKEEYAKFCLAQILDWIECNPVDRGINWVESLEVGTRLISWIWILELIKGAEALSSDKLATIVVAMHQHGKHLANYLSHFISPNTHLTGEAWALYLYASTYPEDKKSQEWKDKAQQVLHYELLEQVGEDGVHKELSTAYHTYTLEYYFQYHILRRHLGEASDEEELQVLEKMCEFIMHAERPDGTIPLIGDSDGGCALPLDPVDSFSWKQLLNSGALLFGRTDFKFRSQEMTWSALWLWGKEELHRFHALSTSAPQVNLQCFSAANYISYRSDWGEKADYIFFDAGKMGFLSAGHSHADYLSFELVISGKPIICDVGTYSYHDIAWRNHSRGTKAHNTVTVNQQDQATFAGSFGWQHIPKKGKGRMTTLGKFHLLQAEHHAYSGICHKRVFVVVHEDFIVCFDRITSKMEQQEQLFEFNFHFGKDVKVERKSERINAYNGYEGVEMVPLFFEEAETSICRGSFDSKRGFIFPTYGSMLESDSLSICEIKSGSFKRGMLYVPLDAKRPQFKVVSEGKSAQLKWHGEKEKMSSTILSNPKAFVVDMGRTLELDCEYIITRENNLGGKELLAIGVEKLVSANGTMIPVETKPSCILFRYFQNEAEIHFSPFDKISEVQACPEFRYFGLT